ncbi:AAA family ATPase [Mycolicibacterium rufum]|uniref:AAA family ATPase n=1 Tax=Mycolicibacterium rufum TaxID=318424 RepID=A0A9X2Y969_9MYCO|nr:adenylate/guanylate cyclase domain-containing protein [Mycolicibacterium rufum]MCV7069185.1 AAA family ATPase [Mycolicibacterium rufum]ULP38459.1 AAA family ATPase [Mycolicibacterium rufum]
MTEPDVQTIASCGSCGNDLRARARFCDVCGSAVRAGPASGEHKLVTVLFADVVGSMRLAAALDAERLREIMNELFNRSAAVVQRYGGITSQFTGDGLMALFGAPLALEDHALRACIAALEIQSLVEALSEEITRRDGVALELRVGLNSGAVVVGEIGSGPGRYTAVGHAVGMAQRMEAAAPPGEVLCSMSTVDLVQRATRMGPVVEVRVKGATDPVLARALIGVEPGRMVLGRNEATMVGRDRELERLIALVQDGREANLVAVVGAPGVGKSRLVEEFCRRAGAAGAAVVLTGCDAHSMPVAFRALSRTLRAMFGIDGLSAHEARERITARLPMRSTDAQILFDAMGLTDASWPALHVGADGRRHRLAETMRRFVRRHREPVVVVVEDVHWIDAASEAVLAEFTADSDATSVVVVMTQRPEYHGVLRRRAGLSITLAPLNDSLTVDLARNLLGHTGPLPDLATRIAGVAGGNPYFVEEIVRDLVGRGVLVGGRGNYRLVGDAADLRVPATVQAVLAARIDRLEPATKEVLNAAAVIGTRFDTEALEVLAPGGLSAPLAELVATELIDQTEFTPRQRYCFRHPLVRTVAYESQMGAHRARAHRQLAGAIEARGNQDENAAVIATHLEAAGELVSACRWHLRAAAWLRMRDMSAARLQWESAVRAADQLPEGTADVVGLRITPRAMLVSTELFVGADPDNDERFRDLRTLSRGFDDQTPLALAMAGRIMAFIVNSSRVRDAMPLAAELAGIVDTLHHAAPADLEIIYTSLAFARWANCDFAATIEVIDRSLALDAEPPSVDRAVAFAVKGLCEVCLGDHAGGIAHLRTATDLARAMPPVIFSAIFLYWGILAGMGLHVADDLIDEGRTALARAQSFGDRFGIIAAQWTLGTLLMQTVGDCDGEAVGLLQRAEAGIGAYRLQHFAVAIIRSQLALCEARTGGRDDAIDGLRALVRLHEHDAPLVHYGCPAAALCELLLERGGPDDLQEVDEVIALWRRRSPGTAAMDRWTERILALKEHAPASGELAGQG